MYYVYSLSHLLPENLKSLFTRIENFLNTGTQNVRSTTCINKSVSSNIEAMSTVNCGMRLDLHRSVLH